MQELIRWSCCWDFWVLDQKLMNWDGIWKIFLTWIWGTFKSRTGNGYSRPTLSKISIKWSRIRTIGRSKSSEWQKRWHRWSRLCPMKTDFERTLGLGVNNLLIEIANRYRIEIKAYFLHYNWHVYELANSNRKRLKVIGISLVCLEKRIKCSVFIPIFPQFKRTMESTSRFCSVELHNSLEKMPLVKPGTNCL